MKGIETGIDFIHSAKMALYLRLSHLSMPNNVTDHHGLHGKAVLVITSDKEPTTENFLEFMNVEKVRLLLLIKEEILTYLQKQFESSAFIEVLKNRERFLFYEKLKHGLSDYILAQTKIMKVLSEDKNLSEKKRAQLHFLFEVVTNTIQAQINLNDKINIVTQKSDLWVRQPSDSLFQYSLSNFIDVMKSIFETEYIGDYKIDFTEIDISGFEFTELKIHPSVFEIVIPEIIINIKRYSPRHGKKSISINYDASKDTITFSNQISDAIEKLSMSNGGMGLKMCREILNRLNLELLATHDTTFFSISILLNKTN